jgi:branched-chain amino acid transport system substrate-binding protein
MSLVPLAEDNKVPLLATIATTPLLTQQNKYTFRYYSIAKHEIAPIVQIVNEKKIEKMSILYLTDDFGKAMLNELKNNFDGEVVEESFNIGDSDFRTQLTKIKSKNPEGILIVGFSSHMINAIKQIKELGMEDDVIIFTSSSATIPEVRNSLKEMKISVFAPAPKIYGELDDPVIASLKQEFDKKKSSPNLEFDHYVVSCYDLMKLIETTLASSKSLTKEDIENSLLDVKSFEGNLGEIEVNEREFNFPLYPSEISDGNIKYLN